MNCYGECKPKPEKQTLTFNFEIKSGVAAFTDGLQYVPSSNVHKAIWGDGSTTSGYPFSPRNSEACIAINSSLFASIQPQQNGLPLNPSDCLNAYLTSMNLKCDKVRVKLFSLGGFLAGSYIGIAIPVGGFVQNVPFGNYNGTFSIAIFDKINVVKSKYKQYDLIYNTDNNEFEAEIDIIAEQAFAFAINAGFPISPTALTFYAKVIFEVTDIFPTTKYFNEFEYQFEKNLTTILNKKQS